MLIMGSEFKTAAAGTVLGLLVALGLTVLKESDKDIANLDAKNADLAAGSAIPQRISDLDKAPCSTPVGIVITATTPTIDQKPIVSTSQSVEEYRGFGEKSSTDEVINKILQEPNNATRRSLLRSLSVLHGAELEAVIDRLMVSDRTVDQEAAVKLALGAHENQKAELINYLLSGSLKDSVLLSLITRIEAFVHLPQMDESHWRLQTLYQTSQNDEVKLAAIHALTPNDKIKAPQFDQIFSLIEQDYTKSKLERLRSLNEWVKSYSPIFSEQQKQIIKQYTHNVFTSTHHVAVKKLALDIQGTV